MLRLKKFTPDSSGTDSPCFHCDLFMLCKKSLNDDGSIKPDILKQINHPSTWYSEREQMNEILSFAIKCKKMYPNYQVKNERVTQHVLVGRGGNEILRANSFLGLIGGVLGTTILAFIVLTIIALIFCGIGSLFK